MSYQRWTEGDAYVIFNACDDRYDCICCAVEPHRFVTRDEMIAHLRQHHHDSDVAIRRLKNETSDDRPGRDIT